MSTSEHETLKPRIYQRSQHLISRKNIDPDALKIMWRLLRHDYKAFLVGGGVRDLLLNKRPKDFDIATDARPKKIKALFRNCRIIGRRFKLAHIYFGGGKIIEVSTFRDTQDAAEDGAEVSADDLLITRDNIYGDECSDALRRDLTINALFYDLSTFSIIDYVGGMEDLENRVVRLIGDADVRLAEDPVRMMRVVRHAVRAGFAIDPACAASIRRNQSLILSSSTVRVYEELKRDLCSGFCRPILQQLDNHGLLQHLLPELAARTSELQDPHSALATLLDRADAGAQAARPSSATPILTLLALGGAGVVTPQRWDALDPEAADRLICDSFSKLAVPRRERERMTALLHLWWELRSLAAHETPRRSVLRSQHLAELRAFLEFVNIDGGSDRSLELLQNEPPPAPEALRRDRRERQHRSGQHSQRGRRGGRPRRGIHL